MTKSSIHSHSASTKATWRARPLAEGASEKSPATKLSARNMVARVAPYLHSMQRRRELEQMAKAFGERYKESA